MIINKNVSLILLILSVIFLNFGCAGLKSSSKTENKNLYTINQINDGLPITGLWRQNIVLHDVNKDGFFDIVAPPQRKASDADAKKPSIYLWDNSSRRWTKAQYNFPNISDYDYGGIAVGDLNNDGFFDIAIAVHSGRIITLFNDGSNNFTEKTFPMPQNVLYHSRAIKLIDINNDGWLDIVSVSEAPFKPGYIPQGILISLNNKGSNWDTFLIDSSMNIFSDFIDVAYFDSGKHYILVAPLTNKEDLKKVIWYSVDNHKFDSKIISGIDIPASIKGCDIDGDGRDELLILNSSVAGGDRVFLKVFKIDTVEIKDISAGLSQSVRVFAIGCADIEETGQKKVIMFTSEGLEFWSYKGGEFVREYVYGINRKDIEGIYGFDISRNKDGSWILVYNLGSEYSEIRGLRALIIHRNIILKND